MKERKGNIHDSPMGFSRDQYILLEFLLLTILKLEDPTGNIEKKSGHNASLFVGPFFALKNFSYAWRLVFIDPKNFYPFGV